MKTETVVENGFKETEIGLIPEDWETTTLENEKLFEFTNGLWKGKKAPFVTIKVIRNTNFNNDGTLSLGDVAELDVEKKQFIKRQLSEGDIILERSGGGPKQPVGRVVFFDLKMGNYSFSNFTTRIRIKDINTMQPKYVLYYLLHFYNRGCTYELQQRTTGIRNLNFKDYKKTQVPLLSLTEQQKVAFVLSKIQQAIEEQDKIIETTKELKKSLMNKLFTEGLHGEDQKKTDIGLIPKSWRVVKLGEFKELITKGSSPRWQGFNYCDRGIIFVRSQNVGFGELLLNDIAYLPIKFNEKEKRSIIKANDILINLVGASIGRAAVATSNIEGGNLNQAVAIVRLKPSYFVPQFLMYYLLTDNGQRQIHLNKKEIARANISLQDVNNFIVPKPEGSEQVEIVNFLLSLDKKLSQADARKQALQALFRTMLNQIMTGRIRVKDLDIEVQNNV